MTISWTVFTVCFFMPLFAAFFMRQRLLKMNISDNGIAVLKKLEGAVKIGNKHVIYDDQTGRPVDTNAILPRGATIGYGHLIKKGEDFKDGISEDKATQLLRTDIAITENVVRNNVSAPIAQNQFDALVIFAFNIGTKNFINSTVLKYINNPNFQSPIYPDLESAWKAWNRSNGTVSTGLINRRNAEWQMFKNRANPGFVY